MIVRLSYYFQRRTVNDEKYIKKHSQFLMNNVKEDGFDNDILIIDNKTTE